MSQTSKPSIVVVGSLNIDYVTNVDHMPVAGETIPGSAPVFIPGGKGANQAVAIGKLGGNVTMHGCVGNDDHADTLINNLAANNVTSLVTKQPDTPTGVAIIYVDKDGDNAIVVLAGANDVLRPNDVKADWFKACSYVVCQLEIPTETTVEVITQAAKQGAKVLFNPAPVKPFDLAILSHVDTLIVNETEYEALFATDMYDQQTLQNLRDTYGFANILLTLGSKGCIYLGDTTYVHVPAQQVQAVDTTAAGDSFIGAFVTSLSEGATVEDSLQFATDVAAITVTRFGAQQSIPTRREVGLSD